MAIFASTTIPYSAPNQALTIKALEKRQADLLAQQAQAGAITPENTQTPVQGFGHVLNALGDSVRLGRAEGQAAASRDALAKIRAGIDLEAGPTAQQIADAGRYDPDTAKDLERQAFEARDKARARAQETAIQEGKFKFEGGEKAKDRTEQGLTRQQQADLSREQMGVTKSEGAATRQSQLDLATQSQKAGANLAQAERDFKGAQGDLDRANATGTAEMKIAAAEKLQAAKLAHETALQGQAEAAKAALPASDRGKLESDITKGAIPEDQAAAARAPEIKPAAIKGLAESKTAYTNHAQEIGNLERASQLMDKGIFTGTYQGAQTGIANVTGGLVGDKEKAQRTTDFNNIINADTIKRMSETLKGASTDFEMKKFIEVYNNPNASDDARKAALNNLITAAKIGKDTHGAAIRQYGGNTDEIDAQLAKGGSAGAGGDAAKSVASEAEALKLEPGTKFKLPDGRTGTAR